MPQIFIFNRFSDLFVLLITFLFHFSYFSRYSFFLHIPTTGLRTESVLVGPMQVSALSVLGFPLLSGTRRSMPARHMMPGGQGPLLGFYCACAQQALSTEGRTTAEKKTLDSAKRTGKKVNLNQPKKIN